MSREVWANAFIAVLFILAGIGIGTISTWIVEAL